MLALGCGEGFLASIVTQKLLNEDRVLHFRVAFEGREGKADVSGYIHDLRAGDHPDRIGVGNDGGVSPSAG